MVADIETVLVQRGEELFAHGALSVDQCSREFGLSKASLYSLMDEGRIPFSKSFGKRLIPRSSMYRFLNAGLVNGEAAN